MGMSTIRVIYAYISIHSTNQDHDKRKFNLNIKMKSQRFLVCPMLIMQDITVSPINLYELSIGLFTYGYKYHISLQVYYPKLGYIAISINVRF